MSAEPKLTLYTYFRSSCSTRVRTAAALKGIKLNYEYVNLLKGEQSSSWYTSDFNPSGTVPTLVVTTEDGTKASICQSHAILEYFEEAFPSKTPLLPPTSQPLQRALVRDLVGMVALDVQPRTNLCVLKYVRAKGIESKEWCQEFMPPGLQAFETAVQKCAGKFSVGDTITLADVVLMPAVEGALRWEIDMGKYPTLMRIYETLKTIPEIESADWKHQPDTPEELRAK